LELRRPRRIRRLILWSAGAVVLLLLAAALLERWFEFRDAERLTASDTFVDVDGARVRYRSAGEGHPGPTVVFLHGGGGSLEQWDRAQEGVATFAPTLAYDRGGSGFSRGSRAHDGVEQADELVRLLAALRMDRPIIVVGFSVSVSLARIVANRYRSKVAGLVLLEPYLPELEGRIVGRHGPWRTTARWLIDENVSTLFGLKRLSHFIKARRAPVPSTALEQKVEGVLLRFPHWWAMDREWLALPETARQVEAAGNLEGLRLTILLSSTSRETGEAGRVFDELCRGLAKRTGRGSVRTLGPVDHGSVLDEARSTGIVVDAIRELAAESRRDLPGLESPPGHYQ
jgi:pimeloyl-ACP methyl ester carboxylesterase